MVVENVAQKLILIFPIPILMLQQRLQYSELSREPKFFNIF